jgi:hypothetical protein
MSVVLHIFLNNGVEYLTSNFQWLIILLPLQFSHRLLQFQGDQNRQGREVVLLRLRRFRWQQIASTVAVEPGFILSGLMM